MNKVVWGAVALVLSILGAGVASAQGTYAPTPAFTAFDNSGLKVSGGKLCTYTAGTATPSTTYSDVALVTPNANPVIADSAGRMTVFLTPGQSYKFVLRQPGSDTTCATGSILWTRDNVLAMPTSAASVDLLGTAGETITAGQCVYLSDGSGSKTAGQWWRCDASNPYSSTLPIVGLAPSAIASGAAGSIRIRGSVSGLSALAAGSRYFIAASAGSVTTTAPINARLLGQADTSTSLIVDSRAGDTQPIVDDFRLSLTTATCVTTTDVTAATVLYLTPCTGNRITVFDANSVASTFTSAELSIAVPATTNTLYDVWIYNNAGTLTLELLAWTSDTARATAIVRVAGLWTKTGDPTRRYLGSMRTTGSSGQTESSLAKRYVWNAFNRVRLPLRVVEAADTWNYQLAAWHQANANAANQLDVIVGLAEVLLEARVLGMADSNTGNVKQFVGIGEDATTAIVTGQINNLVKNAGTQTFYTLAASLLKYPAVGRHYYAWLEYSDASGTGTWYGDNGGALSQSGISGWIDG